MEIKKEIERIAKLGESEVGPTEENVKQKIIVPLLELLGHKREDLDFEYRTRSGGKIDIYIKNVPSDCKVIIDTKNYNENLTDYIEQIRNYTFDENSLLTVIANGKEIKIYSPLRGIAFERSLLYLIKRQDLAEEPIWNILSGILHYDNLKNRNVIKKVEEREHQIKEALSSEEHLEEEYKNKIEGIKSEIKIKKDEIEQLEEGIDNLKKEEKTKRCEIWNALGLPYEIPASSTVIADDTASQESIGKARKVTLQELVDAGLIKDGQTLFLFYNQRISDEQVQIVASSNKVKYKKDGKLYTTSDLALNLLKKHKLIGSDRTSIRGPLHWQTEDGKILNDLNEQVRQKRVY